MDTFLAMAIEMTRAALRIFTPLFYISFYERQRMRPEMDCAMSSSWTLSSPCFDAEIVTTALKGEESVMLQLARFPRTTLQRAFGDGVSIHAVERVASPCCCCCRRRHWRRVEQEADG